MRRLCFRLIAIAVIVIGFTHQGRAEDLPYPQAVKIRYEAKDPTAGGYFTIWMDRETIKQGLDSRLFPAVRYVEITHLTPSAGSPLLTIVEVQNINSSVPDFYHVGGAIRFKVSGMIVKSKNAP